MGRLALKSDQDSHDSPRDCLIRDENQVEMLLEGLEFPIRREERYALIDAKHSDKSIDRYAVTSRGGPSSSTIQTVRMCPGRWFGRPIDPDPLYFTPNNVVSVSNTSQSRAPLCCPIPMPDGLVDILNCVRAA